MSAAPQAPLKWRSAHDNERAKREVRVSVRKRFSCGQCERHAGGSSGGMLWCVHGRQDKSEADSEKSTEI